MGRILIMLVLSLFPVISMSAEYVNYFQEGMEWICETSYMKYPESGGAPEPDQFVSKFYLAPGTGDYSPEQLVLFEVRDGETTPLAAIECEGEKVYFRKNGFDGRYLMYDFGMKLGDKEEFFRITYFADAPVSFTAECTAREERSIGGRIYEVLRFKEYEIDDFPPMMSNGGRYNEWISGLGSFRGVMDNHPELLTGEASSVLLLAEYNGEKVFDNGLSSVQNINNDENGEIKYYLPAGLSVPAGHKGIVISSQGKKIMVK